MQQLVDAQSRCYDESDGACCVLLLCRRRNQIAVLDGYKQTEELSDTEEQCAPAEHESITEMAEEEVDENDIPEVNSGETGVSPTVWSNGTESAEQFYDLKGRPVDGTKKGIYIKNGKKVLVK